MRTEVRPNVALSAPVLPGDRGTASTFGRVAGLRGLSLCAGIGGLDLGLRLALGDAYRTVAYVEREAFACAVLVARIEDGSLDPAPLWDDLATFDGRPWRGVVDLVACGFPCQPWSHAGRRRGADDERWLWAEIRRVLCEVRPRLVFLENVPGLISGGGLELVLADLVADGWERAEWLCLSAAAVGASQQRERAFLLADGDLGRREGVAQSDINRSGPRRGDAVGRGALVADADGRYAARRSGSGGPPRLGAHGESAGPGAGLGDAEGRRLALGRDLGRGLRPQQPAPVGTGQPLDLFPPGPADADAWRAVIEHDPTLKPALRRVADGPAARLVLARSRTAQLRALGNSVVPQCAAVAFLLLAERLGVTWDVGDGSP